MLNSFDWIRGCRDGSELLAVLDLLSSKPQILHWDSEPGHAISGLSHPCRRCWILPKLKPFRLNYCLACEHILRLSKKHIEESFRSVIVWGAVNRIPRPVQSPSRKMNLRTYLPDSNHFLVVLCKEDLKFWLQDCLIHHGGDIQGVFQIFPPAGKSKRGNMGDVLTSNIHDAGRSGPDRLWVRFYPKPFDVFYHELREELGLLPLDITEFINLLEMASIFRTLLNPGAQKTLLDLLKLRDAQEEQFYWGRFMGMLTPESRDMLNAWKLRHWPNARIRLLYDLLRYVPFAP